MSDVETAVIEGRELSILSKFRASPYNPENLEQRLQRFTSMLDNGKVREVVQAIVSAVFDAEAGRLREEVVRQAVEQLSGNPSLGGRSDATMQLLRAASTIEQAANEPDILQILLQDTGAFAPRCAAFLIREGSAIGWNARGFKDNAAVRHISVDLASGLSREAVVHQSAVTGDVSDFAAQFKAEFGAPVDETCVVAPLTVRDKVFALFYADAGTEQGGFLDPYAMQLLTRIAGVWLELLVLRKSQGIATVSAPVAQGESTPASVSVPVVPPPVVAQSVPKDGTAEVASAAAPGGEDEVHRKARRFARLLVEEVKLYNKPAVEDGKLHRNLYERLKDDIDKSRATYNQRYANTAVASADYFTTELVSGLADGDPSLFGSNFPR